MLPVESDALAFAWHEATLVVFTALAPAGILACAACALCVALAGAGRAGAWLDEKGAARLSHAAALPLAVSMVGLVASASHLGTPSNALYVLSGVGRSPLSNEVACAVVFTALAGLYWLYSFAEKPNRALQRVWCCAVVAAGLVAVGAISLAYGAPTIVTWSHWSVPASLWLTAFAGAPLLFLATARLARVDLGRGASRALLACGAACLLAEACVLAGQWAWLGGVANAAACARDLVPHFPLVAGCYIVAGLVAYALVGYGSHAAGRTGGRVRPRWLVAACMLYFAGLLAVRFAFYMTHMTVGISL